MPCKILYVEVISLIGAVFKTGVVIYAVVRTGVSVVIKLLLSPNYDNLEIIITYHRIAEQQRRKIKEERRQAHKNPLLTLTDSFNNINPFKFNPSLPVHRGTIIISSSSI